MLLQSVFQCNSRMCFVDRIVCIMEYLMEYIWKCTQCVWVLQWCVFGCYSRVCLGAIEECV